MELLVTVFAVLTLGIVFLILISRFRPRLRDSDVQTVMAQWQRIQKGMNHDPMHAIIEADKLLDFVLKKKGFRGSLADKLRLAQKLFSDPDSVWAAHKLRNRAAHEVGFRLDQEKAARAIAQVKKALCDLGVPIV